MKTLLMTVALCGLCSPVALARQATTADQAPDAATQHDGAHHVEQAQAEQNHSADTNYRFHNGRWWYWQNDQWLLWNGNRWLTTSERTAQRSNSVQPGRSFSYLQQPDGSVVDGGDAYVPTQAGLPESSASGMQGGFYTPNTIEYQRVLPSYGIRSAGSKVLGNY